MGNNQLKRHGFGAESTFTPQRPLLKTIAQMDNYPDRRLQRKIRYLRRLFERCEQERSPGKRRFAHREYLRAAYEFFAEIGAGVLGTKVAKRIAKLYDVPVRENAGLIRTIIDVSAFKLESKMASRWTRALKFIWSQRQHWTNWDTFVDQHHGIAGCARAMALAKQQTSWPVDEERGQDDDDERQVTTSRTDRLFSSLRKAPRFFRRSRTLPAAAGSAQPIPSSPLRPNVGVSSCGAPRNPLPGRRAP